MRLGVSLAVANQMICLHALRRSNLSAEQLQCMRPYVVEQAAMLNAAAGHQECTLCRYTFPYLYDETQETAKVRLHVPFEID